MNHNTHPPESHPQSDFSELRDRVGRLEANLAQNTESTKRTEVKLEQNTDATARIESKLEQVFELMQFGHSAYGFFTAIGRGLRRFVVWVTPFLTLLGVVWAIFHGRWPEK